jgi:hypothetical protein
MSCVVTKGYKKKKMEQILEEELEALSFGYLERTSKKCYHLRR